MIQINELLKKKFFLVEYLKSLINLRYKKDKNYLKQKSSLQKHVVTINNYNISINRSKLLSLVYFRKCSIKTRQLVFYRFQYVLIFGLL